MGLRYKQILSIMFLLFFLLGISPGFAEQNNGMKPFKVIAISWLFAWSPRGVTSAAPDGSSTLKSQQDPWQNESQIEIGRPNILVYSVRKEA